MNSEKNNWYSFLYTNFIEYFLRECYTANSNRKEI